MLKSRPAAAKIAVLVSGGGTNLQALLDAQAAGVLRHGTVALVVSDNPNAYALTRAAAAGVETAVADYSAFPDRTAFEVNIKKILAARGIDLIVLAGFLRILSGEFTRDYRGRILNVHPSLLPAFGGKGFYGLRVHAAVLAAGVKRTGATVHFVNEIPDGGEILLQKSVPVRRGDTPEVLQRRVMERAEWVLLPRACELVSREIVKERERR